MKKFTKMMAVFAALMMALSFAGCSDDDDGPSAVATYKIVDSEMGAITITFYDNATFEGVMDKHGVVAKGTYTGDAKKAGDGVMTHMMDDKGVMQELSDGGLKFSFTVKDETLIPAFKE